MYLREESIKINDIIKALPERMGPSYAEAECYEKKKYRDSFARELKIEKKYIKISKSEFNKESFFTELFRLDKEEVGKTIQKIEKEFGKIGTIYETDTQKLGRYDGKVWPFFFLEALYFIETEKVMICIMVGNCE